MDNVRGIEEYVASVRAALGDLPARARAEILADLEDHLRADAESRGEQAAIETLGQPDEYARTVRVALEDEPGEGPLPQGRVLGMPYDFRGASVERVSERLWNPADPRVFMPRLFGVGWTINFGALAVKLGLLRPDDLGDEAFDRVPGAAVGVALAIPALLAASTTLLMALSWGSLPAEVPIHWGFSGAPDDWAPKALALGLLFALTVLPVIVTYVRILRASAPARARVLSAAALSLLALLGLGLTVITVADADGGTSGSYIWMVIVGGIVLSFLLLYVPARLGLRAEWRASLNQKERVK